MASRTAAVMAGCIHGSLTLWSSFQEWMVKRGRSSALWIQRRKSSASGFGPAKPPMSWPMWYMPERLMPAAMRMFHLRVCQLVRLSPLQVWT
jgi:hypothetical protein